MSEIIKKLDIPTYVATVKYDVTTIVFCIYHSKCYMKHSVLVAAKILYPRVEQ